MGSTGTAVVVFDFSTNSQSVVLKSNDEKFRVHDVFWGTDDYLIVSAGFAAVCAPEFIRRRRAY